MRFGNSSNYFGLRIQYRLPGHAELGHWQGFSRFQRRDFFAELATFVCAPASAPRPTVHSSSVPRSPAPVTEGNAAKRLFLEILRFVIQTHVKWTRLRQPRLATTSSAPSAAGAWSRSSSPPSSAAESSASPPPWPRSSATTARTPYSRPASA